MTRPASGTVERRGTDAAGVAVHDGRLHGLIPYGRTSRDLGGWREVIDPGALDDADLGELLCVVEHDDARILGRVPGTVHLQPTDAGLRWTCDLPDTRDGHEVRHLVQRGDLRATSWRMVVDRDRWDGPVRHVQRIARLLDVSIVSRAAYGDQAPAELRAYTAARSRTPPETHRMADDHDQDAAPAAGDTRSARVEQRDVGAPDAADAALVDVTGRLAVTSAEPEGRSAPTGPPARLRVEDRAMTDPAHGTPAGRVVEAMRTIQRGESRSLTTSDVVTPDDVQTTVWDALRQRAVVLAAGVPTIATTRHEVRLPVLRADAGARFYAEGVPIDPTDPELDELVVVPRALKSLVHGSSEAFDDASPDLAAFLRDHLLKVHAARLDRELIAGDGTAQGFVGLLNVDGRHVHDAQDVTSWDPVLRAAAVLRGSGATGPLAAFVHPWTVAAIDLLRTEANSNEYAPRPSALPPIHETLALPLNGVANTAPAVVIDTSQLAVIRRQDTLVEVDRSLEFDTDRVSVRARTRAALAAPNGGAVAVVTNLPATAPTA